MKIPKHLGGHEGVTHTDLDNLLYFKNVLNVKTMIDIGCGPGGMVKLANNSGIDCLGVDGDYEVIKQHENIIIHDFTNGVLEIDKAFDLAWSCEFVEHVGEKYVSYYMPLFVKANFVCMTFSEKNGYHHVNKKPQSYWVSLFEKYGFELDKEITDTIRKNSSMEREFVRERGCFFRKNKND